MNERAIAAAQSDATAAAQPAPLPPPAPVPTGERDSLGRLFDPLKFKPKKDSLGRWHNLRGGRKPATPAPEQPASTVGEPGGMMAAPMADKYDAAAEMYCRAFYGIADMVFHGNGEWQPDNEGEHRALKDSLARYLRFKQSEDLPPGFALALAAGVYAAPRFVRPNTQRRTGEIVQWVKGKLTKKSDVVLFGNGSLPNEAPKPQTDYKVVLDENSPLNRHVS